MSSSHNPVPPPAYQATGSARKPLIDPEFDAAEPLLGRARSPGGGFYDQPEQGDIPDDFKVWKHPETLTIYSLLCDCSMVLPFLRVPPKFGELSSAKYTPSYVSTLIVSPYNFAQLISSTVCQIVSYPQVPPCYTNLVNSLLRAWSLAVFPSLRRPSCGFRSSTFRNFDAVCLLYN